jgi:hypothetical protein
MNNLLLAAPLLVPLVGLRAVEPVAAFTPNARILFQGDSITDGTSRSTINSLPPPKPPIPSSNWCWESPS